MAEGKFIAFEGLDGSGLTTQAELLRNWFLKKSLECYLTKEPTDGPVGAIIRLALAKRLTYVSGQAQFEGLDQVTLALLFGADRMDHLATDIVPKLKLGINVITDRYYLSSYAYQGLDIDLDWLRRINQFARVPDLTLIVDTPAQIAEKRMLRQRWHVELYEDVMKLEQVRQTYLSIAKELLFKGERIAVVDGSDTAQSVHKSVLKAVQAVLWKGARKKRSAPLVDQLSFHQ